MEGSIGVHWPQRHVVLTLSRRRLPIKAKSWPRFPQFTSPNMHVVLLSSTYPPNNLQAFAWLAAQPTRGSQKAVMHC